MKQKTHRHEGFVSMRLLFSRSVLRLTVRTEPQKWFQKRMVPGHRLSVDDLESFLVLLIQNVDNEPKDARYSQEYVMPKYWGRLHLHMYRPLTHVYSFPFNHCRTH